MLQFHLKHTSHRNFFKTLTPGCFKSSVKKIDKASSDLFGLKISEIKILPIILPFEFERNTSSWFLIIFLWSFEIGNTIGKDQTILFDNLIDFSTDK